MGVPLLFLGPHLIAASRLRFSSSVELDTMGPVRFGATSVLRL